MTGPHGRSGAEPAVVEAPNAPAPTPMLEVIDLVKSFKVGSEAFSRTKRTIAVDGVTFSIPAGSTMGLIGESGSGKSTVARMICRLLRPDRGTIRVAGRDGIGRAAVSSKEFARQVQIVFQDPTSSLNPRWRVGRLIGEGIAVHGLLGRRDTRKRVVELASLCGLSTRALERFPHEFSGGQRQRIAIARALAVQPQLLILDEPVSALDVSVQAQILVLLQDLQAELGVTYLMVSHDLAVVENFCDSVCVMRSGQIVESGDPAEVHRSPQHEYTRALIEAHPIPDPRQRRSRPSAATAAPANPTDTAVIVTDTAASAIAIQE